MKRLTLSIVLILIMCVTMSIPTSASKDLEDEGTIHSLVGGDKTFAGKLINGHIYVDSVGLQNCLPFFLNSKEVMWDSDSKTVSYDTDLGDEEEHLKFQIGKDYFMDHGENVPLNSRILLIKDKIYIPIKAVALYYGNNIEWNIKSKTLTIKPNVKYDVPAIEEYVELDNLTVLHQFQIDLDKDGINDEIRIITSHYESNPTYFSAPVYLEYRTDNNKEFQRIALDVDPIDLTKDNFKIRIGDLDADNIDEIGYSIDYPQPEHVERWPHILQFREGKFVDIDITKEYELILADWDIKTSKTGRVQLDLYEKKGVYDEPTLKHYTLLESGELEPIS
ncbi:stalk domain-containing protein [Paenibacillus sp. BC26]|uniref:stalk domain-containing protein n=1 Tax=Paenibacillus sp. BC26 TaxID=1881032 RepID=UPI0008E02A9E|nr:stalk domain-containing protein [Paenibacillus sp. BC26]SFS76839.1 Copper amine oxidase N-terminal domain-containing protein [Paenibacillus sp. BC26]